MARARTPRLSWFRTFADDFLGGVHSGALSATECGTYWLLLLAQWGSKERKAINSDPEDLKRYCLGEPPSKKVLLKFEAVDVSGDKCLRNKRMAAEWDSAWAEFSSKSKGGVTSSERPQVEAESATDSATESVPKPHPHPEPDITEPTSTDAPPSEPPSEPEPEALKPDGEVFGATAMDDPEMLREMDERNAEQARKADAAAEPEPPKELVAVLPIKLSKAEAAPDSTGWHLGKAYGDAGDDWGVRFPGSEPPFRRIGMAFRPWIRREANRRGVELREFWDTLGRPAWQNYLTHQDPDYCNPQSFVQKPFQTPGTGREQQKEIKARVDNAHLDNWVPPEDRA